MKSISVFIYNNCTTDARVLKEAKSLTNGGFNVTIYALLDKTTEEYEERDGFRIIRINKNPLHYRILKSIRKLIRSIVRLGFKSISLFLRLLFWPIKVFIKKENLISSDSEVEVNELSVIQLLRFKINEFKNIKREERKLSFYLIYAVFIIPYFFYILSKKTLKLTYILVYSFLRKILMLFHRPLCFADYKNRAFDLVKENQTDYYHCHDFHTLKLGKKIKQDLKGKVVYDSHELYAEVSTLSKFESTLYRFEESCAIGLMDKVITVNPIIAKELAKRYSIIEPDVILNCPPKLVLSRCGIKSNLLLDKVGIKTNKKIILYQGGFSVNRGLHNLVKSMQFVDNAIMIFMGWGKLEEELIELYKSLNLKGKVYFIGPASHAELLNYTMCADIGLIPYQFVGLNNYYCSPNKLFEYINAHIAIATSNFPFLESVLTEYKIGETFDPESPKAIADCMNKMLESEVKLDEYKQNTYRASDILNWEIEEQKLVNIYKDLI